MEKGLRVTRHWEKWSAQIKMSLSKMIETSKTQAMQQNTNNISKQNEDSKMHIPHLNK